MAAKAERAIAGIVFILAVIASVVIVNGGDSASTSATVVVPPSQSTTPRLVPALPPETVTTMTPTSRPGARRFEASER